MIDPRKIEPIVNYGKYMTLSTIAIGISINKPQKRIIEKVICTKEIHIKGKISCDYYDYSLGNCIQAAISVNSIPFEGLPKFPYINITLPTLSSETVYIGNIKRKDKVYILIYPGLLAPCALTNKQKFLKEIKVDENVQNAYIKIDAIDCKLHQNKSGEFKYVLKSRVSLVKLINAPKNTVCLAHFNYANYDAKILSCKPNLMVGIYTNSKSEIITKSGQKITVTSNASSDFSEVYLAISFNVRTPYTKLNLKNLSGFALQPLKVIKGDYITVEVTHYKCNPSNPNSTVIDFIAILSNIVPGKFQIPHLKEGG